MRYLSVVSNDLNESITIHYDIKNQVCTIHKTPIAKYKSSGGVVVWHCKVCIPINQFGFIEIDKKTPLGAHSNLVSKKE